MKELRCREVGFDCEGVIRAETEEEVLRQAVEHARNEHGLGELNEATVHLVRSKIHNAHPGISE